MNARVHAFLAGTTPDDRGRHLADILAWPDDALESTHDFIQWLFPLDEPSGANPFAPVPSRAEFAAMAADPQVRDGVLRAFDRMLAFYGLERRNGEVVKAANWNQRSANWAPRPTHNDLRITRILQSLQLLGLPGEARAFGRFLESFAGQPARAHALSYWRAALRT